MTSGLPRLAVCAIFALAITFTATAADRKPIYDESGNGEQLIKAALEKAAKENKRVLIQWGGNWCGWCHLLHDLFQSDKAIADRLAESYVVVLIDTNSNKALIEKYDAKLQGVPFLTFLNPDNSVAGHHDTGSLEVGNKHDPAKVLAVLKQFAPPTKDAAGAEGAEALVKAALAEAKGSSKNLFVSFGAPWCGWCKRMEALMKQPDFNAIFGEYFVKVYVDTDLTPGGIPWFFIMDGDGKVLITSDGPNGNIGCPYKDAEIAHFMRMVKTTSPKADPLKLGKLEAIIREAAKEK